MAAHPHHNDDLDQLLDSALDDFHNLNLNLNLNNPSLAQRSKEEEEEEEEEEEKEEEKQEDRPSSGVQGLGLGLRLRLPDLKAKTKTKTKTKTETKLGRQKAPPSNEYFHVSEALNQLRTQTREAVKGLESLTSSDADDPSIDDWVKQFEHLAGSQDMESIMETMMQQLLSKEILYEPMKEIGERYPKWLADHKASLSKEELERFSHQYELIKDLNQVYEKEPTNFNKIVELMQKMQECGQPPNDILHQLAPDFDLASLGQISPEMLESQANCCIM